ncbi:MAG: insulinase family protein [Candidatus Cloacimonetes bacterium]|nr:insulinase family protein [Candidatus Cloacimonadota bacterium]
MKKMIFILVVIFCMTILSANDLLFKTLDNGMQVAVKKNTTNNSVAVYGFVKTGAVKEEQFLGCGISHYLEHLVSSGSTSMHTESDYVQMQEQLGLMSNAYTTSDITAYHLTGESAHLDTMIVTIGEFLRYCLFDQKEVDREREVILKEMVMRSTNVNNQIYEWQNAMNYPDTNNKYPVIGYPNLYKQITRDDLLAYYHRHYIPNNIIFVVTGNLDTQATMTKIEETFSDWERAVYRPVFLPTQPPYGSEYTFIKEFDIVNARISLNYIIPQAYYQYTNELNAALDILFSKRQSRINYRLVEEEKLVNRVWGDCSPIADSKGVNDASIGFEPKEEADIDRIIAIIDEELTLASERGFSSDELENYINRTKAAHILYELTPDREANLIGWSLYNQNNPDMLGLQIEALESIRLADMPAAIENILLTGNRVITIAHPQKAAEDVAVQQVETIQTDLSMEKIVINDNVTLFYDKSEQLEVVNFALLLPITLDWETIKNAGILEMTSDLLMSGSKNYDSREISEWLEDHAVSFRSNVQSNGLMITVKCLTDDLDNVLDMFIDGFNHPQFADSEIDLWKQNTQSRFDRQSTTASYQHRIFRNGVLYGRTSRQGMIIADVVAQQMQYTREDVQECWDKYFRIDKFLVAAKGDISSELAISLTENLWDMLRKGTVSEPLYKLKIPTRNLSFEQQYEYEQVNVDINIAAPSVSDPDFKVMKVINALLNRMDGGLHEATRGSNDLAYFAYARYTTNLDYGFLRITSQTSINKKDELIAVLNQQLDNMENIQISQAEIVQVLTNNDIIRRNNINASYLPTLVINNEVDGVGYDWDNRQLEELSIVTQEDIRRVAARYFANRVNLVSYPSDSFQRTVE